MIRYTRLKPAMKVTGIVLAAGSSSRMGQPKQLLSFRGKTVLEWVVDNALSSALQEVIVVLGHEAERIKPILEQRNVTVVINEAYRTGQSTSLQAGLGAISGESDGALFLLGDQPLVTPDIIDRIIAAFAESRAPIVIPTCDGKRGNPVLFSRETFGRMKELRGDCGARPLFQEYAAAVRSVEVQDSAIRFDLDTTEDYLRLLSSVP